MLMHTFETDLIVVLYCFTCYLQYLFCITDGSKCVTIVHINSRVLCCFSSIGLLRWQLGQKPKERVRNTLCSMLMCLLLFFLFDCTYNLLFFVFAYDMHRWGKYVYVNGEVSENNLFYLTCHIHTASFIYCSTRFSCICCVILLICLCSILFFVLVSSDVRGRMAK